MEDAVTKQDIRNHIRQKRKMLSPEWISDVGVLAQKRLVGLSAFTEAAVVFCYMHTAGEVPTDQIVAACWEAGKTVCVPFLNQDKQQYSLAEIGPGTELRLGNLNIPEPVGGEPVGFECVDFVVVPGLGFDRAGGRVGHGAGYYDIMLSGMRARKAGLAFDFQIFDAIQCSGHDVAMNFIITESQTITVS